MRSSLRRAAAGEGAEAMCSSARVGVGEGAGLAALLTSGGLGRYWAAQWHLARAVGKRFRGCRAQEKYTKAAGRRRQGGRRPRRAAAAGRPPLQGWAAGRRRRAAAVAGWPQAAAGGRRRPQAAAGHACFGNSMPAAERRGRGSAPRFGGELKQESSPRPQPALFIVGK